ncbi:hypothetical protein [Paludibacterium paludis]|uniref:Uncharacterized protein n=1 Tax=Paludibacterium paludis TaxID=1225769 RepID=A0A918UC13_9NEIS|nr:hypothetical protein [Paludibacterium paludis]GGY26812.1 hypothetical protein GCM10011289_32990 [Paludibacterium paludis]
MELTTSNAPARPARQAGWFIAASLALHIVVILAPWRTAGPTLLPAKPEALRIILATPAREAAPVARPLTTQAPATEKRPNRPAPRPRVTAEHTAPSAPPVESQTVAPPPVRIDREAIRDAIGAGRAGRTKGAGKDDLPSALRPDAPVKKESRLYKGIDRSERINCRNAYAQLDLLAVPFLIRDTLTDSGCKW